MNRKIKRNIKTDYFFRFISSFTICEAIWVLYLGYRGLSLWQIGLLEGIFHATSLLSEVPSGALADILGRKYMIILSRVCSMVSAMFMLLSGSIWQFGIGFVFSAWSYNFISGSEEALLYDSFLCLGEENKYYKTNSRLSVITEISQGIATFAGGIMAEYSYRACYISVILIAAVSLVPCAFFKEPEQSNLKKKERISLWKHFIISFGIIKNIKQVRGILLFYSLIFTFYVSVYFYSQEYFYGLGLNKVGISVIMLSVGMASCLGALLSEKIHQVLKKHTRFAASFMVCLGIMGMSLGRIDVSVVCFAVMGFANSLLYPLQSASLNRLIPSGQRATILSVSSMVFSLFMIVLFPVIGLLADILQLKSIFLIIGAVLFGILIILGFVKRKEH